MSNNNHQTKKYKYTYNDSFVKFHKTTVVRFSTSVNSNVTKAIVKKGASNILANVVRSMNKLLAQNTVK